MREDLDQEDFPQVPISNIPCYCYQCLKNTIGSSKRLSVCYNYVIPSYVMTKNPKKAYPLDKNRTNSLRHPDNGENKPSSENGILIKKLKLSGTTRKSDAAEEIDYYSFKMETKQHIFGQQSNQFIKNLKDLLEPLMINKVNTTSSNEGMDRSDENLNSFKSSENVINPLSITDPGSIPKSDNGNKSDDNDDSKPKSEVGLKEIYSSKRSYTILVNSVNNEGLKQLFIKKSKNEIDDSTAFPENDKLCYKPIEASGLKETEEVSPSSDYININDTSPASPYNIEIYTLLSNCTDIKFKETNKCPCDPIQDNSKMNITIGIPPLRNRLAGESKEYKKNNSHEKNTNSEVDCKLSATKELWRPLVFSSINNVRAKPKSIKIKKNEGALSKTVNEHVKMKNNRKTLLTLNSNNLKPNVTDVIEEKGKTCGKENAMNLSFCPTLNQYKTNCSDVETWICEEENLSSFNDSHIHSPRKVMVIELHKQEEEMKTRNRKFNSYGRRSKLSKRIVEKCRGEFNSVSHRGNRDNLIGSPEKRRLIMESKNESGNKSGNNVENLGEVKKYSKLEKKYRTVLCRKLCLVKRRCFVFKAKKGTLVDRYS